MFLKIVGFIFFCLLIQAKNNQTNHSLEDKIVKQFIMNLIKRNKSELKKNILYIEDSDFRYLYELPKHSEEEEKQLLKLLTKLKVHWLRIGDEINITTATILINNHMVNEDHKVALVELRGYGTPIQLVKQGKVWRINPKLVINSHRLRMRQNQLREIKEFSLSIDGENFDLNEREITEIIIDGKKHKFFLLNNNVVKYKGIRFKTFYHSDFYKFYRLEKKKESLSLVGAESLRGLINAYDNDVSLKKIEKKFLNLISFSYEKEKIIKQEREDVYRNISGQNIKGYRYINSTSSDVYYDEIFIFTKAKYHFGILLHTNFKDLLFFDKYFNLTLENLDE